MITLTREEAQQVLDALEAEHSAIYGTSQTVKATELLRARLAQPEPEPVAWVYDKFNWESWGDGSWQITVTQNKEQDDQQPLYTAPPQRNWQGLTDEEIMSLLPGAVRLPPRCLKLFAPSKPS
jgi:hypothetical protein